MFDKQKPQGAAGRPASTNPTPHPDRRQAQRSGREKGLRIFITADELEAAGVEPGKPTRYTVRVIKDRPTRRSVIVSLY